MQRGEIMDPMTHPTDGTYRERLWPSPWLMIALLLFIPAVTLTVTPISATLALPIAFSVYLIIAGTLTIMSPRIELSDGQLSAGSARIPVKLLGEITRLDDQALRRTIGPDADARAYLVVRGYIHRAVRIEIADEADPTPYWVITTRRPQSLAAALEAARERA